MLVLYLLGMFGKVVYEEFMIILYVVKLNGTDQENKDYFVNFWCTMLILVILETGHDSTSLWKIQKGICNDLSLKNQQKLKIGMCHPVT